MKNKEFDQHLLQFKKVFERDMERLVKKVSLESKTTVSSWPDAFRKEFMNVLYLFRSPTTHNGGGWSTNMSKAVKLVKDWVKRSNVEGTEASLRPPFNAEYLLYLLLGKEERDVVIGDLVEGHGVIARRFNKRRADIWFYKQVAGSLLPLLRRALLRIGVLVWVGRILRRLISWRSVCVGGYLCPEYSTYQTRAVNRRRSSCRSSCGERLNPKKKQPIY